MLSSQLSSDLAKPIMNRVLRSWSLLVHHVLWQDVDVPQQPRVFALTECLGKVACVQQESAVARAATFS